MRKKNSKLNLNILNELEGFSSVSSVIITKSLLIISLHIERSGNIDYLKQRTVRITEPIHQIQLLFP